MWARPRWALNSASTHTHSTHARTLRAQETLVELVAWATSLVDPACRTRAMQLVAEVMLQGGAQVARSEEARDQVGPTTA